MLAHRIGLVIVTLGLSAAMLVGCGESASTSTVQAPAAPAVTVPATLFMTAAPDSAVPLIEAKTSAKQGDEVVFAARIGGRAQPFVEQRAVFFVADASLQDCDQLHPGTCKAPWDYCCEPRDNLLKHMATVQIVDDQGQPLKASLYDQHGLLPSRTVVVRGTVDQMDDAGNFVVNAEAIFVDEG